jgi:hypothetical protein
VTYTRGRDPDQVGIFAALLIQGKDEPSVAHHLAKPWARVRRDQDRTRAGDAVLRFG